MNLDDLSIDFDINEIIENIKDGFFKIIKTIFMMIFNLPTWVKITFAILFVLFTIGIGYLTWKYRDEWRYVKY